MKQHFDASCLAKTRLQRDPGKKSGLHAKKGGGRRKEGGGGHILSAHMCT